MYKKKYSFKPITVKQSKVILENTKIEAVVFQPKVKYYNKSKLKCILISSQSQVDQFIYLEKNQVDH